MGNCYYTQYGYFGSKYIAITFTLGTSGMDTVPDYSDMYVASTGDAWINIWYSVFSV
jgi:hypothetical protein